MKGNLRGDRLKLLRTEREEDYQQTGAAVGVDRSYISKMEAGTKQPSLAVLVALASHFEVSPDFLLGWSDQRLPRLCGKAGEDIDQGAVPTAWSRISEEDRRVVTRFLEGVAHGATDPKARRRKPV